MIPLAQVDPATHEAAEKVGQALGLPAGLAAAFIVIGLGLAPILKRLAFLVPVIRGMFQPEGYEKLRGEVEAMSVLVKQLAASVATVNAAVEVTHERVSKLEDRQKAEDDEERIEAEVKRRVAEARPAP